MKLQHLFETTEEDRALVSLATAIYARIQSYSLSSTDDCDPVVVGKIGEVFDTPLEPLRNITVLLYCHDEMLAHMRQNLPSERPESASDYYGFWMGVDSETMILNRSKLEDKRMRTIITHELRHALDDYKSEFKANVSPRYNTARKSAASTEINDYEYLGQPAEINARFAEVLHLMTGVIRKAVRENPRQAREVAMRDFFRALRLRSVSDIFPEKEQSRAYKRLIKRGVDFIEKELAYRLAQQR